jgi:hypothetical protein
MSSSLEMMINSYDGHEDSENIILDKYFKNYNEGENKINKNSENFNSVELENKDQAKGIHRIINKRPRCIYCGVRMTWIW